MTEPRWKQRYRAPTLTLPRWGIDQPDHLVYASNLSGSWQVHAWDHAAGTHRQVTDHPTGVVAGTVTPDGAGVVWFDDDKGNEIGRWLVQPFAGGEPAPLLPGSGPSWSAGPAPGPKGRVAGGRGATASGCASASWAATASSCTGTSRPCTSAVFPVTAGCWSSITPSTAT